MFLVTICYQTVLALSHLPSLDSAPQGCNHLKETLIILCIKRVWCLYITKEITKYISYTPLIIGLHLSLPLGSQDPCQWIRVSFPFSNGLIRHHYHLLIEMMKLLTVVKLLSLISPVQYCGVMQIVTQFERQSVHRKWRCGVFYYVSTHLGSFSLVFLLTVFTSTFPKDL